jgi:hypothetical protein
VKVYSERNRRNFVLAVCWLLACGNACCASSAFIEALPKQEPAIRLERLPVPGGADLTTVFLSADGNTTGKEIPVVSFLRDDLGGGGRLRDVWVLTYTRPTLAQRLCAVLPFPFFRAGQHRAQARPPKAFLDAAAPYRRAVEGVIGMALRSAVVDPSGLTARAPALSYEGNISEHRRLHLFEAVTVLRNAEGDSDADGLNVSADLQRVESKLTLSDKAFGDLVSENRLVEFHKHDRAQQEETRGHNWDLLRQKAESNGLYFQPLAAGDSRAALALLWISSGDLAAAGAAAQPHAFDGSLIGISNPWTDSRLVAWTGYAETWRQGSSEETMIPLALYSLDHPRAPFLLVDFRDTGHPRRDEIGRRMVEDVPRAVLGFAFFANWEYRVASSAWSFVRGRQGAATARGFRTRAYAEARWNLLMDTTLQPALRDELGRRLDALSLNPIREDRRREADEARAQYERLALYAQSPDGLAGRLNRDRRAEMTRLVHGRPVRAMLAVANAASLGIYRHRENDDPALLTRLEERRRLEARLDTIRAALESGPRVDVVTDMNALRSAVRDLAAAGQDAPAARARLVGQLVLHTGDDEARMEFVGALRRMNDPASKRELARLALHPDLSESWQRVCLDFLNQPPDAASFLETEGH